MENKPDNYDPGIDQNQGVVGTMARNQERSDATDSDDRVSRLDPNVVTDQNHAQPDDEAAAETNDNMGERAYIQDESAPDSDLAQPDNTRK